MYHPGVIFEEWIPVCQNQLYIAKGIKAQDNYGQQLVKRTYEI